MKPIRCKKCRSPDLRPNFNGDRWTCHDCEWIYHDEEVALRRLAIYASKTARELFKSNATSLHPLKGWVILHPNGWVETDYFGTTDWTDKSNPEGTQEGWRRAFRSECRMVLATLTIALDDLPEARDKFRQHSPPPPGVEEAARKAGFRLVRGSTKKPRTK